MGIASSECESDGHKVVVYYQSRALHQDCVSFNMAGRDSEDNHGRAGEKSAVAVNSLYDLKREEAQFNFYARELLSFADKIEGKKVSSASSTSSGFNSRSTLSDHSKDDFLTRQIREQLRARDARKTDV